MIISLTVTDRIIFPFIFGINYTMGWGSGRTHVFLSVLSWYHQYDNTFF